MASSPTAPSSPPHLRALLFDADHTLPDTSEAERCALRAVVDRAAGVTEAADTGSADYNSAAPLERKRWTRLS